MGRRAARPPASRPTTWSTSSAGCAASAPGTWPRPTGRSRGTCSRRPTRRIDALEAFAAQEAAGEPSEDAVRHVEEELGDLLFQVVLHAELGDEQGYFNFTSVADALRDKLIGRHPHVFGDATARDAAEVVRRWEDLKKEEKGRTSLTDGIAWQQPSLTLYSKLAQRSVALESAPTSRGDALERARRALADLEGDEGDLDAGAPSPAWGDALTAIVEAARWSAVDLEGVLRERALRRRDEIRALEQEGRFDLDE